MSNDYVFGSNMFIMNVITSATCGLKHTNIPLYNSLCIVFIGGEVMEIGLKDSEPKCR